MKAHKEWLIASLSYLLIMEHATTDTQTINHQTGQVGCSVAPLTCDTTMSADSEETVNMKEHVSSLVWYGSFLFRVY